MRWAHSRHYQSFHSHVRMFQYGRLGCVRAWNKKPSCDESTTTHCFGWLTTLYRLFGTVCCAGLFSSSWALTFCKPAVSASICFCCSTTVVFNSCIVRCSLRNSFSNAAPRLFSFTPLTTRYSNLIWFDPTRIFRVNRARVCSHFNVTWSEKTVMAV